MNLRPRTPLTPQLSDYKNDENVEKDRDPGKGERDKVNRRQEVVAIYVHRAVGNVKWRQRVAEFVVKCKICFFVLTPQLPLSPDLSQI